MSSWFPLSEIANQVNASKVSAVSMVNTALKQIESKAEFKAIIATTKKTATERARQIDQKIKMGKNAGRLAGVPFIAKDNFLAFGAETTAASNILKGFNAPYQATAINRLEAEGAILVAKANLDAFAHGSSTENSDFFTTLNPHDKKRVPGGSSGGSAAAVVLGMAPFALGTDTGGSIRLPAAFCGAVGYKPSYGLVSRSGVVAMASSTDVIGPITSSVADAGLVLDVMAGYDELDSTTIAPNKNGYELKAKNQNIKGKTIGLISQYFEAGVDATVKKQVLLATKKLRQAGAKIINLSLPSVDLALACYYVLCPAEVSSNLSRYDGQRFGYSDLSATTVQQSYKKSRAKGFGKEAKRRIMIGTYVLTSGYYDAYYKKAQIVRTKLINEFNVAFKKADFLVGPTSPITAFKIGDKTADPLSMYLTDIMTVAANLVGNPAVSLPIGKSNNLPVGLQIMSSSGSDRELLQFAAAAEAIIK